MASGEWPPRYLKGTPLTSGLRPHVSHPTPGSACPGINGVGAGGCGEPCKGLGARPGPGCLLLAHTTNLTLPRDWH